MQLLARGQSVGIAQHLHRSSTDPGPTAHRCRHAATFEQRADDASCKAIAGPHRVDHLLDRKTLHEACTLGIERKLVEARLQDLNAELEARSSKERRLEAGPGK